MWRRENHRHLYLGGNKLHSFLLYLSFAFIIVQIQGCSKGFKVLQKMDLPSLENTSIQQSLSEDAPSQTFDMTQFYPLPADKYFKYRYYDSNDRRTSKYSVDWFEPTGDGRFSIHRQYMDDNDSSTWNRWCPRVVDVKRWKNGKKLLYNQTYDFFNRTVLDLNQVWATRFMELNAPAQYKDTTANLYRISFDPRDCTNVQRLELISTQPLRGWRALVSGGSQWSPATGGPLAPLKSIRLDQFSQFFPGTPQEWNFKEEWHFYFDSNLKRYIPFRSLGYQRDTGQSHYRTLWNIRLETIGSR